MHTPTPFAEAVSRLCSLFLVGVVLASPPATATADDTVASEETASGESFSDPREVVRTARERLSDYSSITMDIRQNTVFGGRKFEATGRYVQGTNLRLRLEFDVRVGQVEGRLLQVCDGEDLWTRYDIALSTRLTLRKVQPILQEARKQGLTGETLMRTELGLGGLPALIAAIEDSTVFDTLRHEELDGVKLVVVEGGWNERFRERFNASELTPYAPDRIRLYFDERLFPRRIRYLKTDEGGKLKRPLVTLDFVNAEVDGPVDESLFEFAVPTGVFPRDVTDVYLRKLQQPLPTPQ